MKWLREPLVHFLLIGALIYLFYGLYVESPEPETNDTIMVSTGEIEWMQTSWAKRWNRLPTDEELAGLIDQYIRETVLYREALAMGLDKNDVIIRRRLAQKLEFLGQDLLTVTPPSDEELQAWFEEHQERYQEPARFTYTQLFIDPDKRGDATLADAERIKATLIAQPDAFGRQAGALGDDFMLQSYYPENSRADIQKLFGSGFADSLVALSPGEWHGPVLSGYGVHLVYVQSASDPPAPVFADVRERVAEDWETAKREDLNEQFYTSLRDRYIIVVEEPNKEPSNGEIATAEPELSP